MDLRVLGAVEAWSGGVRLNLGSRKQRLVLAVLLLEANRLVPVDRLIDFVWGTAPPPSARGTVQALVSRLRAALRADGGDRPEIVHSGASYLLRADPFWIDVHRFGDLIARARAADDGMAIDLFGQALGLWRGDPLADVASAEVRERLCGGLSEARWSAVEDWLDVRMRLGESRQVLEELTRLVAENPMRQRLVGQLMLVLHQEGRTNDALQAYHALRAQLVADFGLDPPLRLRDLAAAILRADPDLTTTPTPPVHPAELPIRAAGFVGPEREPAQLDADRPHVVPAQLPAGVPGFAGRREQLTQLDAAGDGVVILIGTAGIGKTALALHWGHQARDRFPDGQLYLNLRGFDASQSTVDTAGALRSFLEALGIALPGIPDDLHARAGLYRSLLVDRRVLVVLDNARDVEQLRMLLPGAPGCLVVITSRHQLTGLVATAGARPISLGLLDETEARDLLQVRLGSRVLTEPQAAGRIIERCARLPLALALAAARAAVQADLPLQALADDLDASAAILDALHSSDPGTDLRSTFSWSYHGLSEPASRMFRLLGLHAGPDISPSAAASLAAVTVTEARRLLLELVQAQLLTQHRPQRYFFHDLLMAYAGELSTAAERDEATPRILGHYLHHAWRAAALLEPNRENIAVGPADVAMTIEPFATLEEAMAWMQAEHAVIIEAVTRAHAAGFDTYAWQLAWTLATFLRRQGLGREWIETQRIATQAAERANDVLGQAHAFYYLAAAQYRHGNHDSATTNLRKALDRYRSLGDHYGQASTHYQLCWQYEAAQNFAAALDHAQLMLKHYRLAGHLAGQGRALGFIGWYQALLGDYEPALEHCHQALKLLRETNDATGEGIDWDSIGYIHHQLGDYEEAASSYEAAVAIHRELDDRYNLALTLSHLGDTHLARQDAAAANAVWEQAYHLMTELAHPEAETVRAKLTLDVLATRPLPPVVQ